MESVNNHPHSHTAYKPKWLTLLRVALGIILLLKGFMFFEDTSSLTTMLQSPGFKVLDNNAEAFSFFITYLNLLGGVFIIAGLFTRWVSLLQVPLVIGAIIFVNSKAGMNFSNPELALSILVLLLLFVFIVKGSGTISADEFFRSYTNAGRRSGFTKKFFQ